jgi:hypothetical protein
MALNLVHLDARTRELMLEELERDIREGHLFDSPRLNAPGRNAWPDLLRQAITSGDEEALTRSLWENRYISAAEWRSRPTGGYTRGRLGEPAARTLAEGEYNRYYIRAVCRRALREGHDEVVVYRAKPVQEPRERSQQLVGQRLNAGALLADLRAHPGMESEMGVPGGPNSGLSVRLPQAG